MPYDTVIATQRVANTLWHSGVKPWSECLKTARGSLNTTKRMDPSDPMTPAYMRDGMSDVERAVTLRDAVVFGATVEVKGENLEFEEELACSE